MKKYSKQLIGIPLIALLLSGGYVVTQCQHDPANLEQLDTVCFETQVLPIIQDNCTRPGCHSGDGGEFALKNYKEISGYVKSGSPSGSKLYNVITAKFFAQQMPPDYALSQSQRSYIRIWILQGAKETTCSTDTTSNNGTTADAACFTRDILPALNASCAISGCHDAITAKGGYTYTTYAKTMNSVIAGNVSGSKLYKVITGSGEDLMPPTGSLPKAVIDSIASWIKLGAKDATCSTVCDLSNVTFSKTIMPILTTSCISCHSAGSANGGVVISDYASVKSLVNSGKLIGTITQTGYPLMPTSGALSSCSINQIKTWITAGSLNN